MDATEEYEVSAREKKTLFENCLLEARSLYILLMRSPTISVLSISRILKMPPNSHIDPSKHLGILVPGSLPQPPTAAPAPPPASISVPQKTLGGSGDPLAEEYVKPDIEEILSLHDFEAVARRTMNRRGWNYYSS